MTVLDLEFFGGSERGAQTDADIIGDVLSAGGQHDCVPDAAFDEDGDIGSPATDVGQYDTHFTLHVR